MEIKKSNEFKNIKPKTVKTIKLDIVKGVKFCVECGTRVYSDKCKICGSQKFYTGDGADKLQAYLKISHDGLLKRYARKCGVPVKRGSNKKVLWDLMIKDGHFAEGDTLAYDLLQKIFWRRSY